MDRKRCTVVGVLAELESTDIQNCYQSDPNEALIMPISAMIQLLYEEEPSVYMVAHVTDASRIDEAKEQITAYLREKHQIEQDAEGNYQDDFDMTTRNDILGQQQEAAQTFSLLLAAMATVSLAGGRDRHHECDAGQRDRADARDRRAPGGRRETARYCVAVPVGGGLHQRRRRAGRDRDWDPYYSFRGGAQSRSGITFAKQHSAGVWRGGVRWNCVRSVSRPARSQLDPIEALRYE